MKIAKPRHRWGDGLRSSSYFVSRAMSCDLPVTHTEHVVIVLSLSVFCGYMAVILPGGVNSSQHTFFIYHQMSLSTHMT
jgi:hypothetical protein